MHATDQPQGARSLVRDWIIKVLELKRWTPHRLAKEAGVSPATIHRALDPAGAFVPSTTTLEKIAKACGVPAPGAGPATGFREPDAELLKAQPPDITNTQETWVLRTRAAELAGWMPGDEVTVDAAVEPRAGDLVLAQSYDLQLDTAETIFRIYDPPFLVARTMDPRVSAKPITVDDRSVMIVGTVVRTVRGRAG